MARAELYTAVHEYDLPGGGRALIKPRRHVPLVTLAVAARGGSHNEDAQHAGLSALMARTSIKGTAARTAAQIAEETENMGGSVSPSVSADVLDWELTVPARHFAHGLELLADVAFNAAFPEAEFLVEQKLALADLQQSRDDMYRYPLRLCLQQAFRGHAYGNTFSDIERTMSHATPAVVAEWHQAQVPDRPWVFVVGDVSEAAALQQIEKVIPSPSRSRPRAPSRAPARALWQGGTRAEVTRDKAQSALAIAFPGPDRNDADSYVMQVLSHAVGGLGGRFVEELRSRRSLAYTVALVPFWRWLGGAFVGYLATSPERAPEAREALLAEFARLVEAPLPAADVQRAQRYTIGTRQIRSQTNGAQLADLMYAYMLGEGGRELSEFEERIRAVTPQAIQAAAARYFKPELAVEGMVRGTGAAR